MVMDLIVDLYWSFRSPYSYIVLPRIIELLPKPGERDSG
jgi:2-hydroxychromene-2-carboxylate isomerase